MTHICVGNLTITGSDNGLSPDRHQAIIWSNAGILSTGPLGTNSSEILIKKFIHFIFHSRRGIWKRRLRNGGHFASALLCWSYWEITVCRIALCPISQTTYEKKTHYSDVIMSMMASKITSLTIIYATVYSGADEKKTSTLRVTGLSPVTGQFPAQGPVTRKMFPFDDVIMHWHFGASIGDKRPTHNFLVTQWSLSSQL